MAGSEHVFFLVSACLAALLMVRAGVGTHAFVLRDRTCPACRRHYRGRVCPECSRR